MNIRIWVTIKRMTNKIRSLRRPLIRDYEIGLRLWSTEWKSKRILGFCFLGEFFQKGYTRKSIENRVTRCKEMFWGNLGALRCFTKRIVGGGIGIGVFWEGCAWDHVGL
jgi:hypothetical protein